MALEKFMARKNRPRSKEERIQSLFDEYGRIGDCAASYRTPDEQARARERLQQIIAEIQRLRADPFA
jgi:hypothetical protein